MQIKLNNVTVLNNTELYCRLQWLKYPFVKCPEISNLHRYLLDYITLQYF